MSDAALKA